MIGIPIKTFFTLLVYVSTVYNSEYGHVELFTPSC